VSLSVTHELAGGAGRGLSDSAPPAGPRSPFRRAFCSTGRTGGGRPRHDHGAVTAETAVVLPVLVAVTLGLVWAVALAVAQVRLVDAARETARAAARDESVAEAVRLGRRVAPQGAEVAVVRDTGTVRVRVSAEVAGPGGLFRFLPGVRLDAEALAAREPS
jgi:Flp pilus assembly protein TadG